MDTEELTLDLVKETDPILSTPVRAWSDSLGIDKKTLVKEMLSYMIIKGGIGLAAPQIGLDLAVFVMGTAEDSLALFNPRIVSVGKDNVVVQEGCLSFPGLIYQTPRAMRVVAKGFNMYGEPILIEGSELMARALQHETDHLDGILFIDKLSKEDRKLAMKKIRESDWFNLRTDSGSNPIIKTSPHDTLGKGF